MNDRMLTLRQISDQYGIPYNTLKKYAYEGKLPVYRIGRRVRVDAGELRRWLKKRKNRLNHGFTGLR